MKTHFSSVAVRATALDPGRFASRTVHRLMSIAKETNETAATRSRVISARAVVFGEGTAS